jgi:hypothetical protein
MDLDRRFKLAYKGFRNSAESVLGLPLMPLGKPKIGTPPPIKKKQNAKF